MKHLGDITLIKGNEAPTVDCIIGGSPCQDLSLAGKRAGLAGARSGLYMEQIRIIKEMREADVLRGKSDVDVRPRYMVWENVPGAFSTNQGKDFAAVLEEAIRVAEPEAPDVDVPEKGWPTSGCLFDEMGKWSVAWRVLDAQFWGTSDKPLPQRRRRIALVADFGGLSASEILFVRKSVSGDLEPGKPKGKETAGDAGEGSGGAVQSVGFDAYNQAQTGGVSKPLTSAATDSDHTPVVFQHVTFEPGIASREGGHVYNGVSGTLRANAGDNQMAVAYDIDQPGDPCHTLNTDARNYVVYGIGNGQVKQSLTEERIGALNCMHDQQAVLVPRVAHTLKGKANCDFREDSETYIVAGVDCRNATEYPELNGTVQAKASGGFSLNCNQVARVKHIVRRLTPLECERLQGFPDNWTLIGDPVEEEIADYVAAFDESKYIAPNPADFGLTEDDLNNYAPVDDEDSLDDGDDYDDNYLEYLNACTKARAKATKRVKVGSHKEINYYYTDSSGKRKKVSDSKRYKALGNSIALPPWKWILKRLCACYERDATMASLFDGIGGFPYIWEQLNGKGSCLWASEIEEFPMAVTKLRFGG